MTRHVSLLLAALAIVASGLFAPPAAAAGRQVMMQNYAFTPASLTVRVGDAVTWVQHDSAPHDVVTTSAPVAIRSPQLSQGQSWSYTFDIPGTYSYYCSVHPDMRAQLTVLPAPTPTQQNAPAPAPSAALKHTTTPSARTTGASSAAAAAAPAITSAGAQPSSEASAASPLTSAAQSVPAIAQQAAQTSTSTLDPMLLVAGLVTGVAVLCLLLLSSRRA
jgi:plastocyanin